jgi:hypothetical protein
VNEIERALDKFHPLPQGPTTLRYHAWKCTVGGTSTP